jgi:excisionase family DNA binding protein
MAIGLPKDASGAIVPFSTTMMYRENGNQFHVTGLFYEARPGKWLARQGSECIETNKLYVDRKDVLVNRPKKTTPQNAAQANGGVTLSTLPEYATLNEWAEAFNVSLRTVYRMCSLGELMTVKVRGSILIYRDSSFVLLGLDR